MVEALYQMEDGEITFRGHSDWCEYDVPERWTISLTFVGILILGELLFPGVIGWFYELVWEDAAYLINISLDEVVFLIGLVVVHELVHVIVFFVRGYWPNVGIRVARAFFGIPEVIPYVVALDQEIERKDDLMMLGAPLLFITGLAIIGLLPIFPDTIHFFAKMTIVVNTAGSSNDLYNVLRIGRMPRDTIFLNINEDKIRTYYRIVSSE